MSKIGRKPINIDNLTVDIKGQNLTYKGSKVSGSYVLSSELTVRIDGKKLFIAPVMDKNTLSQKQLSAINRLWGLQRSLLANKLGGAIQEFEKVLEINGLGYKAALADKKIVFNLGYSDKNEKNIPAGISVEIDKSGQKIKVKSADKALAGQFCTEIEGLRKPDPYKGKGIKLQTKIIFRKTAKGKK